MKDRPGLPSNPTETLRKLNPQLYAKPQAKDAAVVRGAAAPSPLEDKFLECWRRYDPDGELGLQREFRFAPPRRWRFDFAWPSVKVAVEVEGGVYDGGRHTRAQGFIADCDKYNHAAFAGYAVFRLPTGGVTEEVVGKIHEFIKARCSNSSQQ